MRNFGVAAVIGDSMLLHSFRQPIAGCGEAIIFDFPCQACMTVILPYRTNSRAICAGLVEPEHIAWFMQPGQWKAPYHPTEEIEYKRMSLSASQQNDSLSG